MESWKRMLPELLPEYSTERGRRIYTDRTKLFLRTIEEGLPRTVSPRRIDVVGAGVSGLVAASLLAGSGHEVRVFEASTRVGGRVMTLREPFTEGLSSEAGAMRLIDTYELVFEYIEKFGLKTVPFINHDEAKQEWIFVNGVKVHREQYEQDPDCLGFPTVGEERGKTGEALWLEALEPITRMVDPTKNRDTVENWARVVEKYGTHSVYSYLRTETELSPGAIEMIEVMVNLESRSDLSLMQQIVETVNHEPSVQYFGIDGGMDRLPRAFVPLLDELGVKILFNHRLKRLDRSNPNGEIRATYERASTMGKDREVIAGAGHARELSYDSDAVVLTIPFTAMRYLDVDPPFSQGKRKAIRELNYNASTKIFLEFDTRFWETVDGIFGGHSITDLPVRFVYYPSSDLGSDQGGIVIASYTWASEAKAWDSLGEARRVEYALDNLAKIHGEYIRRHFVVGTSQSWQLDSYSIGEAAMLAPGQFQELEGFVLEPDGNIFFGGDATSFKVAWIEGAIEAGIRTAYEASGLGFPPKD